MNSIYDNLGILFRPTYVSVFEMVSLFSYLCHCNDLSQHYVVISHVPSKWKRQRPHCESRMIIFLFTQLILESICLLRGAINLKIIIIKCHYFLLKESTLVSLKIKEHGLCPLGHFPFPISKEPRFEPS